MTKARGLVVVALAFGLVLEVTSAGLLSGVALSLAALGR